MIDDDIKTHVLARCAEAYPTLDQDQFIFKVTGGTALIDQSIVNQRNDSNAFAMYETTANVMLIINTEDKIDRDTLIRKFRRGWLQFGNQKVFQEYQRWQDADMIEVIAFKGVIHYVDYSYIVYES